uniref:Uncharacterized protein n=1 Tax=Ananas comosus var. bracteatus TaxID=296719 RepID=A0A6V7NPE9_ANACO|nr:unnamed protein product [Ananas comosus var. bracteatus]
MDAEMDSAHSNKQNWSFARFGRPELVLGRPEVECRFDQNWKLVVVPFPNELLAAAASRPGYALGWVQRNVAAYYPAIQIVAVAVDNEMFASPRSSLIALLVPAMTNVHAALARLGLDGAMKVSSPIALTALRASYPPSAGAFPNDLAERVMRPMLDLLRHTGSYLMVNAYTFFAYSADAALISLDYAAIRPDTGLVTANQVFDLHPQRAAFL